METPLTLGEQTGLHGSRCAGSRGRTKPWSGAGPKLCAAQRASQAAPILARLHRGLNAWKTSGTHLPASSMGQAIDYALGQWNLLGRYLHDGRLEIDNNQVEPEHSGDSLPKAARRASAARQNAIRPTAVGKKNRQRPAARAA